MNDLFNMAGMDLPKYLGSKAEETKKEEEPVKWLLRHLNQGLGFTPVP